MLKHIRVETGAKLICRKTKVGPVRIFEAHGQAVNDVPDILLNRPDASNGHASVLDDFTKARRLVERPSMFLLK